MGVTLPYTITNGTPHDAVPVQRNFEALRDGHNTHAHDGVDTPKVNFADVDGKPATYPPSSHTHLGTDVTSAVAKAIHATNADSATNASNATNADTVDGAHAGTGPNNVLKLDASGKVPSNVLPGAGLFYFASAAPFSGTRIVRVASDTDYGSWHTVGPTGSGAAVTWSALDAVPAGARAVRLNLFASITTLSSSGYVYAMLRQAGSGVSPGREAVRAEAAASSIALQYNTVDVQLDSNRRFEMLWTRMGPSVTCTLEIYLEGWYY